MCLMRIILERFLPFVTRTQCCKIWLRDILYIRQDGRMLYAVTESEIFGRYDKIKSVEKYLDRRFYPCMKSLIINFQQVSIMKDQTIFFKNGEIIPLGRQNYVHTKQAFALYIKNPCNFNDFIV